MSGTDEFNGDLQQQGTLTSRTSKITTRSLYFLFFSALTRQIRTAGVKTKAFRFIVCGRSVPSSETSNFQGQKFLYRTQMTFWEKSAFKFSSTLNVVARKALFFMLFGKYKYSRPDVMRKHSILQLTPLYFLSGK